jgi:hypothetical protein
MLRQAAERYRIPDPKRTWKCLATSPLRPTHPSALASPKPPPPPVVHPLSPSPGFWRPMSLLSSAACVRTRPPINGSRWQDLLLLPLLSFQLRSMQDINEKCIGKFDNSSSSQAPRRRIDIKGGAIRKWKTFNRSMIKSHGSRLSAVNTTARKCFIPRIPGLEHQAQCLTTYQI